MTDNEERTVFISWNDILDDSDRENYDLINEALADLYSSRVSHIHKEDIFAESKLAWKHYRLAQSLNYRLAHLADAICLGWNERRLMGAILASRAFIETEAIVSRLLQKTRAGLEKRSVAELNDFLDRATFNTRDKEILRANPDLAATSILTEISRLDRRLKGVSAHYDLLSEICHPNYRGHAGLFSKLDTSSGTVTFSDDMIETKTLHSVFAALMLTPLARNDLRDIYALVQEVADLQISNERG